MSEADPRPGVPLDMPAVAALLEGTGVHLDGGDDSDEVPVSGG